MPIRPGTAHTPLALARQQRMMHCPRESPARPTALSANQNVSTANTERARHSARAAAADSLCVVQGSGTEDIHRSPRSIAAVRRLYRQFEVDAHVRRTTPSWTGS
jgi:hypothetical protein